MLQDKSEEFARLQGLQPAETSITDVSHLEKAGKDRLNGVKDWRSLTSDSDSHTIAPIHKWAEPHQAHLRQLMRFVVNNPAAAKKKGADARQLLLQKYGPEAVADALMALIHDIEVRTCYLEC